jgi:hypothetical protein
MWLRMSVSLAVAAVVAVAVVAVVAAAATGASGGPGNKTITTIPGTGVDGHSGDGGQATSAHLSFPDGLAVDGKGNVYIADTGNQIVRTASTIDPIVGDWNVTYGAPAVVTMSLSGGLYTVTAKTPVRVSGSSCDLPPGTILATFSSVGGRSYSGQHGLWYLSDCSFGDWTSLSLTLSSDGSTLTAVLGDGETGTFTKASGPPSGSATGTVLVNGQPFTGGVVPYGSSVDVTNGKLDMSTEAGNLAVYGAGVTSKFKLVRATSKKGTVVELRLIGGDFSSCGKRVLAAGAKSRKPIRRLWGKGKGRFKSKGRFSTASVRGTTWLTEDSCEGTRTFASSGVVSVYDSVKKKTINVRAGRSYWARPKK